MRYWLLIIFIYSYPSISAQSNWEPLITDDQLSNFQKLNGSADYVYVEGVLTGITRHYSPNTFLATTAFYDDFILEFEVKIEQGMNSGVQIRSENHIGSGSVHGYQVKIETSDRKWAGGIYDEGRRGWMYPLSQSKTSQNAFKNDTWNTYRIEAVGPSVKTYVNGIPCAHLVDDWTSKGFIAFQVHSIGAEEKAGKIVQWRNIRILTEDIEKDLWTKGDVEEISYLDNRLTQNEIQNGWQLLESDDWQLNNKNGKAGSDSMVNNGIVSVDKKGAVNIVSVEQFSDFEFSVDFKVEKGNESGILYLTNPEANNPKHELQGLKYQIVDDTYHPDSHFDKKRYNKVGDLFDLIPAKNLTESNIADIRYKSGQYNRARIKVTDGKVEHWLNDIKILEYDLRSPIFKSLLLKAGYKDHPGFDQDGSGHIVLQASQGVLFKNMKIRQL
ncbi:MAG: DUF1080 domain-containing protein [Bacteroidia bacterium]|nr:DUF1080 domain-containing protein [Bacteroidia bacterium]